MTQGNRWTVDEFLDQDLLISYRQFMNGAAEKLAIIRTVINSDTVIL
jgi:hypothetical protein